MQNIFRKILTLSHFPTLILIAGYVAYWVELFFIDTPHGKTSFFVLLLLLILTIIYFYSQRSKFQPGTFSTSDYTPRIWGKIYFSIGFILTAIIISVGLYAALYPIHLIQESDTLFYHLMIPRQHLIRGDFTFIRWAVDDILLLPIDFALAPYSLLTALPNKIMNFPFFIGLVLIAIRLGERFSENDWLRMVVIGLALCGSTMLTIQVGTSMLDLIMCYVFLAALDSLLSKNYFMAMVEFTFYFWSKSFIPIQMILILIALICSYFILKCFGFKKVSLSFQNCLVEKNKGALQKCLILFGLLSIVIAGPFVSKAVYHVGTPFFPLGVGLIKLQPPEYYQSSHWAAIIESVNLLMKDARNSYGVGRDVIAFFKHLWLIAVPDMNVNNSFDYPIGLVYLLVLGPFFVFLFDAFQKKIYPLLPMFIVFFWGSWWFSSQQSRFLYIPITLMIILTISLMKPPSKIFLVCILFALLVNSISFVRTHKHYLGKKPMEVLRPKDAEILKLNKKFALSPTTKEIEIKFHDVAYAQFPVICKTKRFVFTLVP